MVVREVYEKKHEKQLTHVTTDSSLSHLIHERKLLYTNIKSFTLSTLHFTVRSVNTRAKWRHRKYLVEEKGAFIGVCQHTHSVVTVIVVVRQRKQQQLQLQYWQEKKLTFGNRQNAWRRVCKIRRAREEKDKVTAPESWEWQRKWKCNSLVDSFLEKGTKPKRSEREKHAISVNRIIQRATERRVKHEREIEDCLSMIDSLILKVVLQIEGYY